MIEACTEEGAKCRADAQLSVYVVSADTAARESGGHQGHQIPQRVEIITFGGPSKEGPKEVKKWK